MSVLFVLLPLSLLMACGALYAFIWATKKGQFEDLDAMGQKLIADDKLLRNGNGGKLRGK